MTHRVKLRFQKNGKLAIWGGNSSRHQRPVPHFPSLKGIAACGRPIAIPEPELDRLVLGALADHFLAPERLPKLLREAYRHRRAVSANNLQRRSALTKQLTETDSKNGRLYTAVETGTLTDTALLRSRLQELEKQRDEAVRLLRMLDSELPALRQTLSKAQAAHTGYDEPENLPSSISQFRPTHADGVHSSSFLCHCDETKTLPISIPQFCLIGADGGHVWIDRWELNVGDSLISKIQGALTESDAILIILSKNSVASEWCKKELNAGLMRELEEKKVLVLPCIIDDCDVPLFLREKLHADFRQNPDEALGQVHDALLRITNRQQGRIESPDFHTDWSCDWSQGRDSGLWYFEWTFVDHGNAIEYCVLTQCRIACNQIASEIFQQLDESARQDYIYRALAALVKLTTQRHLKIRLKDAFLQVGLLQLIDGVGEEAWLAEITSRRMGIDNGKDTLIHVDQILERALKSLGDDLEERKKRR